VTSYSGGATPLVRGGPKKKRRERRDPTGAHGDSWSCGGETNCRQGERIEAEKQGTRFSRNTDLPMRKGSWGRSGFAVAWKWGASLRGSGNKETWRWGRRMTGG